MKHSYHQHVDATGIPFTLLRKTLEKEMCIQLVLKTTAGLFKHVYIHILILLGSFQPENYFSLFLKQALIIMV